MSSLLHFLENGRPRRMGSISRRRPPIRSGWRFYNYGKTERYPVASHILSHQKRDFETSRACSNDGLALAWRAFSRLRPCRSTRGPHRPSLDRQVTASRLPAFDPETPFRVQANSSLSGRRHKPTSLQAPRASFPARLTDDVL